MMVKNLFLEIRLSGAWAKFSRLGVSVESILVLPKMELDGGPIVSSLVISLGMEYSF